jgi:primosomal protein N''
MDETAQNPNEKKETKNSAPLTPQEELTKAIAELAGISSIRDIIFGDKIHDYDQRFEAISQELKELRRFAEEKFAQLHAEITQQLQATESKLSRRITVTEQQSDHLAEKTDTLYEHLVAQIDALQRQLQKTESELIQKITVGDEKTEANLTEKTDTIHHDFVSQINQLRTETQQNITMWQKNLLERMESLVSSKLDRTELTETLVKFGGNLKEMSKWIIFGRKNKDKTQFLE